MHSSSACLLISHVRIKSDHNVMYQLHSYTWQEHAHCFPQRHHLQHRTYQFGDHMLIDAYGKCSRSSKQPHARSKDLSSTFSTGPQKWLEHRGPHGHHHSDSTSIRAIYILSIYEGCSIYHHTGYTTYLFLFDVLLKCSLQIFSGHSKKKVPGSP